MRELQITLPDFPLYRRYPGQSTAQPSYVFLDLLTGEVWCDYSGEIGNAVPCAVWHGVQQRWLLPSPALTPEAIEHIVRNIEPLLARVLAGSTVEWRDTNQVGVPDDDANAASYEISDYMGAFWINDFDTIELGEDE